MVALGRRITGLSIRAFRAARHEASKDKYREYLSQAYGDMRQRYPAVENTAKEALDAIGVKPKAPAGSRQSKSSRGPARKKKTAAKTTSKKASAGRATRKKTVSKKKTGAKNKAA
jgi:hypothetical protein